MLGVGEPLVEVDQVHAPARLVLVGVPQPVAGRRVPQVAGQPDLAAEDLLQRVDQPDLGRVVGRVVRVVGVGVQVDEVEVAPAPGGRRRAPPVVLRAVRGQRRGAQVVRAELGVELGEVDRGRLDLQRRQFVEDGVESGKVRHVVLVVVERGRFGHGGRGRPRAGRRLLGRRSGRGLGEVRRGRRSREVPGVEQVAVRPAEADHLRDRGHGLHLLPDPGVAEGVPQERRAGFDGHGGDHSSDRRGRRVQEERRGDPLRMGQPQEVHSEAGHAEHQPGKEPGG